MRLYEKLILAHEFAMQSFLERRLMAQVLVRSNPKTLTLLCKMIPERIKPMYTIRYHRSSLC